jgi:hypothetical protein
MEQRNLPLYRSQAEITAEAKRRQQNYRTPLERAIYDIAIEWSPYTNYTPRAGTRYTAIRKTLVQRIRKVLRGNPAVEEMEEEEEGENIFNQALPLGTGSGRRRVRGGFTFLGHDFGKTKGQKDAEAKRDARWAEMSKTPEGRAQVAQEKSIRKQINQH